MDQLPVTNLMAYRNRRERALLFRLLELSERAPIQGLAVCMISAAGDVVDATGQFEQSSPNRLLASLRLSMHLNDVASV